MELENKVSQVLEGNVEGAVFARVGSGFKYELDTTGEPQYRNGTEAFRLAPDSFSWREYSSGKGVEGVAIE